MRSSVGLVVASVLAVFAPAAASLAADPTPQDYVKELQAAAPPAAAPADAGTCENGEKRDESGACPVVDESEATRGFTLFPGSAPRPQGPARSTPAVTAATARPMSADQGRTSPRCGLLCDLKVSFRSGSADLTPDSESKLLTFADALRDPSLASRRFEIAGHTDASGSADKNRSLSLARAEAVKRFLVDHGVPAGRLEAKGYGSEGLAFPNAPLDPRNRRVEARVLN